jgi:hypothetical protein
MDRIDITMTGVLRPEILKGTLINIYEKVCKKDTSRFRLILNIDPVGELIKPKKLINLASNWFSKVVWNIPETASFPKAVKWVWSQVEAPYVFHWEDDFDILREIDVDNMISILKKYDNLSSLRLCKYRVSNKKQVKIFDAKWIYHEEGFYMAETSENQFGLNPILIKKEFIKEALPLMKDDYNPEKQFRLSQTYMVPIIKKWKYGIYSKPGEDKLVEGGKGQEWKDKIGLRKPKRESFLKWEKK